MRKQFLIILVALLISLCAAAAQPASWPSESGWVLFGTDATNNGPNDDWRDIANVSLYCDGTYLFLRETMYGEPALPGDPCSPGEDVCTEDVRYKYFLNLLPSDGETFGDFLIFIEDRTSPVSGQYELYFVNDTDNDDDFDDDMDENVGGSQRYNSSSANFIIESPGLINNDFGYRVLGSPANSVDFYLRLSTLGITCSQFELLAATDQDASNPVDQQPTTDVAPDDFLTPQYCGDGIINDGEECDANGQNGVLCVPAYGGSCTYCSSTCTNITLTGDYCGDGTVNGAEECEDSQTQSCTAAGGYAGTQTCSPSTCTWGACIVTEYCGDGIINDGEECELNSDCDDKDPETTDTCGGCVCEHVVKKGKSVPIMSPVLTALLGTTLAGIGIHGCRKK
ncbi:hypothetical protein JXA85_03130 [Candidatus Woesearchaeota archaeon]|nr:hypothetical protein [Candidatus Woesearchaeota archaeon]